MQDVRPAGAFRTRRRRACSCGHRFTTFEITAEEFALLDILDGGIVAKLHRDAKKVSETIDRMVHQRQVGGRR